MATQTPEARKQRSTRDRARVLYADPPGMCFIVDALYAKRHFRNPRLVHVARVSDFSTKLEFVHVEVIAATDGIALDVEIDLDPRPDERDFQWPILVALIDREHPFGFRFEVLRDPAFTSTIKIRYRDFADESYSYEASLDAAKCLGPWNRDVGVLGEIRDEIRELRRDLGRTSGGLPLA